jgi:predicted P-loop ATPase
MNPKTSPAPLTPAEAALDWIGRGYWPIPVPYRDKNPGGTEWQNLRIAADEVPQYFNGAKQNIGVMLGDERNHTDVDLDCKEAIIGATVFLPPTRCVFGRKSKPYSHWFYVTDAPMTVKKFPDPIRRKDPKTGKEKQDMILELRARCADGHMGLQSIVPPSAHPSGERVSFEPGFDGEASEVDADELSRAVSNLAAAALLAKHFPGRGARHEAFLALAGTLVRAGWGFEEIERVHHVIYLAIWPDQSAEDWSTLQSEIRTTVEKFARDSPVTGFPKLSGLMDEKVVEKALEWLGTAPQASGRDPRPTPREGKKSAASTEWKKMLLRNTRGILPGVANVITTLRQAPEWKGVLAYNEFALTVTCRRETPWGAVESWEDHHTYLLMNWFQHHRLPISRETAEFAIEAVARDRLVHPVREYLDGLKWDGTERIATWLVTYMGAKRTKLHRAFGSRWLISAAARIYEPGVQADHALILEGPQGQGKSTALSILGGAFYSDDIAELGTKDASLATAGVWIVELAELGAMHRAAVSKVKAFLSRRTDHFRPPYGRRMIWVPRQCVFAGTVNPGVGEYLQDDTGGRRFWPVECSAIDLGKLAKDRDQLWAEAVHQYRREAKWWLDTSELNAAAERVQEARFLSDPWEAPIADWVAKERAKQMKPREPDEPKPELVTVANALEYAIMKSTGHWTRADENRVGVILRRLGLMPHRFRLRGALIRVYEPAEGPSPEIIGVVE